MEHANNKQFAELIKMLELECDEENYVVQTYDADKFLFTQEHERVLNALGYTVKFSPLKNRKYQRIFKYNPERDIRRWLPTNIEMGGVKLNEEITYY